MAYQLVTRLLLGLVVLATSTAVQARPIKSRSILKTYFETGDVPTQDDFWNFIDTLIHNVDDRDLLGLHVYGDEGYRVKRLRSGVVIPQSPNEYALPAPSSPLQMAPDFAGQFGFVGLLYGDATGGQYSAFLQVHMDALPSADGGTGPAIHVQYLVMETSPGAALTTFAVPEPAAVWSGSVFGLYLLRRRR